MHCDKGSEEPEGVSPKFKRATVGGSETVSIVSKLNESTVYCNGAEEIATFTRIMQSFLALDPSQRPCAVKSLLDPGFEDIS